MKYDPHRYITVAAAWAPYGGPSAEDIYVNFGVSPRLYFDRLSRMVGDSEWSRGLPEEVRERIVATCRDRLLNAPRNCRPVLPPTDTESHPARRERRERITVTSARTEVSGDHCQVTGWPLPNLRWIRPAQPKTREASRHVAGVAGEEHKPTPSPNACGGHPSTREAGNL